MRFVVILASLLLALGSMGCARDDGDTTPHNNSGNNTNDATGEDTLKLVSVDPSSGPLQGGTVVKVYGRGFAEGIEVYFGDVQADATFLGATTLEAVTPPAQTPGAVDVKVVLGDKEAVLTGGFVYEGELPTVGWCRFMEPAQASLVLGEQTVPVVGRVYVQGVTEGDGQGAGVIGEAGYGPAGSDPRDGSWKWTRAEYVGDVDGLSQGDKANDEYSVRLRPTDTGDFIMAYRFSVDGGQSWTYCDLDGSDNGFSAQKAATLTVSEPDSLVVTAVEPDHGPAQGIAITVHGAGFSSQSKVYAAGQECLSTTYVGPTELRCELPPSDGPGYVEITVQDGTQSHTLPDAFYYDLEGPVTVDGTQTEWTTPHLVATNDATSDWSSANRLQALYVAFDATYLYIAIEGTVEPQNTMVAYIDVDYGQGTGIRNGADLTDVTGEFDNAVSGTFVVEDASFGAEFAAGVKGMNSIDGQGEKGGLREITHTDDFWWYDSEIAAGQGFVEMALPKSVLFGTNPVYPRDVAIFVVLTNYDGTAYSNQALPPYGPGDSVPHISSVFVTKVW